MPLRSDTGQASLPIRQLALLQGAVFLVNSRSASFVVPRLYVRGALSRSYGRCIAEFLNEGSLIRLSLLDLSTCVGLRYGCIWLNDAKLF